jgi:hypothetical protein
LIKRVPVEDEKLFTSHQRARNAMIISPTNPLEMTLKTNSRLAGLTFLLYIVVGISSIILSRNVMGDATDTAAKLLRIAEHASVVRADILIALFTATCALILAVTLYALTRHIDRDLAMIALCCRLTEGVIGVLATIKSLALVYIATSNSLTPAADAAATHSVAGLLFAMESWILYTSASCFALGSTIFCYLFLRARSIPASLAWLGLLGSILLLVILPLQLAGYIVASFAFVWIPMLIFEIAFAIWLLVKGITPSQKQQFA